jgi:hypothetical protein
MQTNTGPGMEYTDPCARLQPLTGEFDLTFLYLLTSAMQGKIMDYLINYTKFPGICQGWKGLSFIKIDAAGKFISLLKY